jgi:hypothetical protein
LQNNLAVKSSDQGWLLRRYFRFSGGVFATPYRHMTRCTVTNLIRDHQTFSLRLSQISKGNSRLAPVWRSLGAEPIKTGSRSIQNSTPANQARSPHASATPTALLHPST